MKASDFYDATHLFFRDLLAYWLPGAYLLWVVNKLLGHIPSIGVIDARSLTAFQLSSTIALAVLAGYMSFPFGHWSVEIFHILMRRMFRPFTNPLTRWLFEEEIEKDVLRHIRDHGATDAVTEKIFKEMMESAQSSLHTESASEPISPASIRKIFAKHITYTYAQDRYPDLYKTLVPRHYSLKLFHENLTGISIAGFFWSISLWSSKGLEFPLVLAGLAGLNCCAAVYYSRKRQIAIQCLVIVARAKERRQDLAPKA